LRLLVTGNKTQLELGDQSHAHGAHAPLTLQINRGRQLARNNATTLTIHKKRQFDPARSAFRKPENGFPKTAKPADGNHSLQCAVMFR